VTTDKTRVKYVTGLYEGACSSYNNLKDTSAATPVENLSASESRAIGDSYRAVLADLQEVDRLMNGKESVAAVPEEGRMETPKHREKHEETKREESREEEEARLSREDAERRDKATTNIFAPVVISTHHNTDEDSNRDHDDFSGFTGSSGSRNSGGDSDYGSSSSSSGGGDSSWGDSSSSSSGGGDSGFGGFDSGSSSGGGGDSSW